MNLPKPHTPPCFEARRVWIQLASIVLLLGGHLAAAGVIVALACLILSMDSAWIADIPLLPLVLSLVRCDAIQPRRDFTVLEIR